ncbi:MAG: AAA family ATPase, partial [Cyanobacteria bacterium J06635_15]
MMRSHTKAEILAHNRESLQRLERAVRLSVGQFSVVLVRCDYERLQSYVIEQLQSQFDGVQVLALEANTPSVVMAIRHHLQTTTTPPTALVVTQLWALSNLNQALKDANLARDQLRSLMDCPLILWLSDRVVRLISRYAQDFKNQAPPTIPFDYPLDELIYALHQGTNQLFQQVLEFGSDVLPETALNLNGTSRLRNELEAALNDLGPDQPLDPDLTASLDFLRGRDAHSRTEMEAARAGYQRSLAYWQERAARGRGDVGSDGVIELGSGGEALGVRNRDGEGGEAFVNASTRSPHHPITPSPSPLEKTAILHFYLGLWWRSNAVLQRVTYEASLRQAQQNFAACLAIFKVLNQPQRQAQFIHALAEVLQKQRDWRALAAIAQESLALHEQTQDWVRQARDRGFLAEVALANQDWQTARAEALNALDLLTEAERQLDQNPADEPLAVALAIANRFQRGWYRFLLGEAQMHLGTPQDAIALLAEAQAETNPELDLTLYRQILDELIHHYFEAGQYREAFRIKQERRAVEFRYNLRAFIGAGAVQPHKRSAYARPLDTETQTAVAAEIAASGREHDIERLVQRLKAKHNQLIVIHGPSGVGKSSIVNAGLTPALRRITPEGRNSLPILIQTYVNWQQAIETALDQALAELPTRPTAVRTRFTTSPTAANSDPSIEPIPGKLRAFNKSPSPSAPPFLTSPTPPLPHSPTHSLLSKLQALNQKDYFIVLLFDQFEEFFFEKPTLEERRLFYEFLGQCLNRLELSFVKVVLSLREDYLHHLLEVEKVVDLSSSLDQSSDRKDNDILSRDIRYRLDNFSLTDAEAVIRKLTRDAQFYLDDALIAVLVQDLALETGDVRPIELQVVGAQLQREGITTLDQYRDLGETPKQTLVQKFLAYTVADCGPPNEELATNVLHTLTEEDADKRLYRPLRTREEIEESLARLNQPFDPAQLDLVLVVLVGSGLVFEIPDDPDDRYQLVHDYLVAYVHIVDAEALAAEREARLQAEARERLARLEQERLAEANRVLAGAKVEADETVEKAQKRAGVIGVAAVVGVLVALALASTFGGQAFQARRAAGEFEEQANAAQAEREKEEERANRQQTRADRETAKAEQATRDLRVKQREAREARAEVDKAEQELAKAEAEQERIQQRAQASEVQRQRAEAQVQEAEEDLANARIRRQEAEIQVQEAEEQLADAQAQRELALKGTELERAGVAALNRFGRSPLEALYASTHAATELKTILPPGVALKTYPAYSPLLALQTTLDLNRERYHLEGHESWVRSATFSPDGSKVVTASD